jgi:FtsP/CotA-like multicopper oxidase with cupredoxin domain
MNKKLSTRGCTIVLLLTALLGIFPGIAAATIIGAPGGTTFNLYAKADNIATGDGDSMYMWGYALGSGGRMQYPGPTIIVNQNDAVTINLYNQLPLPVSIVFPGQAVTATGGTPGLLTMEAPAVTTLGTTTGPVTYTFTALQPGTYIYYSGTRPDLEVEMGMVGTIIVRPSGFAGMSPKQVYSDPSTAYDREYLVLLTEADPTMHKQVAFASGTVAQIQAKIAQIDTTTRRAVDWFINGRNLPDTMADATPATDGWLPTQPYNCMPMAHPAEKVLMRMVSAGMDFHPFHTHGQNHLIIARDGRLLTTGGSVPDLAVSDYTTTSIPGETVDAIWGPWTGAQLGWDVYGHTDPTGQGLTGANCTAPLAPNEYLPDHCKPIPVELPAESNITYGPFSMYGGTPYLGVPADKAPLNPGSQPELNTVGALTYMWHSHSERELTTNDIFIGGMGTMMMIVPADVTIP